jgi:hypothetical protein
LAAHHFNTLIYVGVSGTKGTTGVSDLHNMATHKAKEITTEGTLYILKEDIVHE